MILLLPKSLYFAIKGEEKMPKQNEKEIMQKMIEVANLIEQDKNDQTTSVEDMLYYQNFEFKGSGLAEKHLIIAKIVNEKESITTYQIYSADAKELIATVNEKGKIHFRAEYLEALREIDGNYLKMLDLEDLDFELPKDLEKEDKILTKQEREEIAKENQTQLKDKEPKKEEKGQEKNQQEKNEAKDLEEEKREKIARKKQIPSHNILMVRENSNLYKDHPNLEKNLYFYRDSNGTVKAEYLDENGNPHPSHFFEDSSTVLRQETVSLGDDGNPVTKEVPYQVMRTKNLNTQDQDIRDIRMTINIDSYGYLEIEEARQGRNGQWLSHPIEVKGRDYNSYEINKETSIRTRKANPDEQTKSYEKVENTGLEQDGVTYDEMYLIEHAQEIIERFIKEGYQKKEAVQIFDYMIGEETLTEEQAKQRVNEKIKKEDVQEISLEEQGEERTPWGDAERRQKR